MWRDMLWISNLLVLLQATSYIVSAFGIIGILMTVKQANKADKKELWERFR